MIESHNGKENVHKRSLFKGSFYVKSCLLGVLSLFFTACNNNPTPADLNGQFDKIKMEYNDYVLRNQKYWRKVKEAQDLKNQIDSGNLNAVETENKWRERNIVIGDRDEYFEGKISSIKNYNKELKKFFDMQGIKNYPRTSLSKDTIEYTPIDLLHY